MGKVDLTSDPKSLEQVKEGAKLEFSLHVQFEPTSEEFHSRFDRYLDHEFFKHPIHWFSVFNSFMMVLFLMGLVALILLRTLKKDYARYGLIHDLEDGEGDEDEKDAMLHDRVEDAGWKQVHGDVFRAPAVLPLFAALVGTGWQLVILTFGVILFAVLGPVHGEVHEERGEMMQAILICYAFSTVVSGFMSGKYFKEYYPTVARGGKSSGSSNLWQAAMGLTVVLLPVVTVLIFAVLNSVSLVYGTINSIPFLVLLKLFFLYVFVSVPLCVAGTLLGRHSSKGSATCFPCRVNAIPRPIPEDVPWYGKPSGLIPLAGLLSFGSIFIELYYVLTSLWNYKFYHVYGFLVWCLCYFDHRGWYDLYHCCVLLSQRGKLSLAVDCLWIRCIDISICIFVRHLLLYLQTPDAWLLAILFLFWLHVFDRHQPGTFVWYVGPCRC